MDDLSSNKSRRRGVRDPYDPEVFRRLQQESRQQEEQRLDHNQQELPTVWVYLPFKHGSQEDQRMMAESFIRERTEENPREGKRYKLVEHTGGEGQLERVKSGDTLYVFSHGAERDTNHIYTHDGQSKLSVNGLVNQMLAVEGLDPDGVKLKLGNCYSAHTEHQTKEQAQNMETFTSNFTQSISEQSLRKGRGLPQYVDGYIGGVQNQNVIVSEDGRRHRGANLPEDEDQAKKIQSLELIKLTSPDKVQAAAKLTEPFRARDNRWRYRPQQTGVNSVQVNLDEGEFDRVSNIRQQRQERERLEAEQRRIQEEQRLLEELTQKFGGMEMDMPSKRKGRGAIKF